MSFRRHIVCEWKRKSSQINLLNLAKCTYIGTLILRWCCLKWNQCKWPTTLRIASILLENLVLFLCLLFPFDLFCCCVDSKTNRFGRKNKQRPNLFHIHLLFLNFHSYFFFFLSYSYQLDAFVASLRLTIFSIYFFSTLFPSCYFFFCFNFLSFHLLFLFAQSDNGFLFFSLYFRFSLFHFAGYFLLCVFFSALFLYFNFFLLIVWFMHCFGACCWSINEITFGLKESDNFLYLSYCRPLLARQTTPVSLIENLYATMKIDPFYFLFSLTSLVYFRVRYLTPFIYYFIFCFETSVKRLIQFKLWQITIYIFTVSR